MEEPKKCAWCSLKDDCPAYEAVVEKPETSDREGLQWEKQHIQEKTES